MLCYGCGCMAYWNCQTGSESSSCTLKVVQADLTVEQAVQNTHQRPLQTHLMWLLTHAFNHFAWKLNLRYSSFRVHPEAGACWKNHEWDPPKYHQSGWIVEARGKIREKCKKTGCVVTRDRLRTRSGAYKQPFVPRTWLLVSKFLHKVPLCDMQPA